MSEPDTTPPLDQHPAVRDHVFVCMGALALMLVALVLRRPDPWALFPPFIGALGLLFRWRAAPVMVLLAIVLLLFSWWHATNPGRIVFYALFLVKFWLFGLGPTRPPSWGAGRPWREILPFSDLLLAVSLLAYAAGQYRLQGLTVRLFPSDPRQGRAAARRGSAEATKVKEALRRSPDLVSRREIVVLLLALPACGGLASLFWAWLSGRRTQFLIADEAWQGMLVLWLLGGGVLAAAAVLRYLALRRMTPAEAAMYLQDVLWRETRGEQRLLNRWLAWAWLRRRRREEKEQS
ncbi:MAG TPA: hypothetical protein VKA46_26010 [Gemmataceae bacterium]|nr:hypothetical protein [Gemmataceae bacterium]